MSLPTFPGHLAVLQRVVPIYRKPFFDQLAACCDNGLTLLAGQPKPIEGINTGGEFTTAHLHAIKNRHISHPGTSRYLCWQSGIPAALDKVSPDALIVEANPRYLSTPRAIKHFRHRFPNKPVLGWSLGAPPITDPLAQLRERQRKALLRSLDGVIAYSERGATEFRDLNVLPSDKVFVAHNAVSPRPETPPPDKPDYFEGQPRILFVGRLQARKKLDLLFHACAALPPEQQPLLTIVGDGPDRAAFEALAADIYPAAEFVGAKYGDELVPYYRDADLFVLPGTGGLAVQQAMNHGLPIIVAQGDGTQDDLVRAENGWQIPPNDQLALNRALAESLANPADLRAKGRASFRIVSQEINLQTMAQTFVNALISIFPE